MIGFGFGRVRGARLAGMLALAGLALAARGASLRVPAQGSSWNCGSENSRYFPLGWHREDMRKFALAMDFTCRDDGCV